MVPISQSSKCLTDSLTHVEPLISWQWHHSLKMSNACGCQMEYQETHELAMCIECKNLAGLHKPELDRWINTKRFVFSYIRDYSRISKLSIDFTVSSSSRLPLISESKDSCKQWSYQLNSGLWKCFVLFELQKLKYSMASSQERLCFCFVLFLLLKPPYCPALFVHMHEWYTRITILTHLEVIF